MEELMRGKIQAYYGTDTKRLYLGDCLELLRKMKPESVDMIFADPPYFLSNNGITCQGGRMVSVNKASWDEGGDFKENHAFNRRWIRMCRRVLKPGGTIWISGTLHNIYSIGMALQQERYKIILPGRKQTRRPIWPAAASPIPQRRFCGPGRMKRRPGTCLTTSR